MERIFRVKYGEDGYLKDFTDEKTALEFEAKIKKEQEEELVRQKRMQEERAKAVAKAEAERKAKEEVKEYRYNQVLDRLESFNKAVEAYEKEAKVKLDYAIVKGRLSIKPINLSDYMRYFPWEIHF